MFSLFRRARRLVAPTVLAVLTIEACDDSNTLGLGAPAFSLTLAASTLSLSAGSTTATAIRATRSGGLVGAITYSVSGAPPGLTAGITATSVPDSVTLVVG